MTGNIALDVAIGLVFVYCLYSLLTTTIAEFIAVILQLRSKNLHRAVRRMLDDGKTSVLAERFYNTPLIKYMARCLVTAIALTLGAPFWFDLLNKIMKLRSSVSIGKSATNPGKTGAGETT